MQWALVKDFAAFCVANLFYVSYRSSYLEHPVSNRSNHDTKIDISNDKRTIFEKVIQNFGHKRFLYLLHAPITWIVLFGYDQTVVLNLIFVF